MVMAGENATNDVDEEIYRYHFPFLPVRKLQQYCVLLNHRQMLREWRTTRHTFHSEIGVRSVLRVVDEVFRTDELL